MERVCRNCMWLYHMVTYNPTAPCSECLDHNKWQTTKMTNYDEIRAMSVEELAEFLGKVTAGGYGMCAPGHYDCEGKDSCAPCWLEWLKQEVACDNELS